MKTQRMFKKSMNKTRRFKGKIYKYTPENIVTIFEGAEKERIVKMNFIAI